MAAHHVPLLTDALAGCRVLRQRLIDACGNNVGSHPAVGQGFLHIPVVELIVVAVVEAEIVGVDEVATAEQASQQPGVLERELPARIIRVRVVVLVPGIGGNGDQIACLPVDPLVFLLIGLAQLAPAMTGDDVDDRLVDVAMTALEAPGRDLRHVDTQGGVPGQLVEGGRPRITLGARRQDVRSQLAGDDPGNKQKLPGLVVAHPGWDINY
jgi:hypothetical protein